MQPQGHSHLNSSFAGSCLCGAVRRFRPFLDPDVFAWRSLQIDGFCPPVHHSNQKLQNTVSQVQKGRWESATDCRLRHHVFQDDNFLVASSPDGD